MSRTSNLPNLDDFPRGPFDLPVFDATFPIVDTRNRDIVPFTEASAGSDWIVRPTVAGMYGPGVQLRDRAGIPPLDETIAIATQEFNHLTTEHDVSVAPHSFGWLDMGVYGDYIQLAQLADVNICRGTRLAQQDGFHLAALVEVVPRFMPPKELTQQEWDQHQLDVIDMKNAYSKAVEAYLASPSDTGYKLGDIDNRRQTVLHGSGVDDVKLVIVDIEPLIFPL